MRHDAHIDLALEPVTSFAALDGIARDWGELWWRCPDTTPFQAPEWLIPWWRAFGNGELRVLAFRQRNRLAGLVPLYVGAPDDSSRRIVRLLGSGNSDYLDALIEPGLEDAVVALAFRHLEQHRARWDRCDFPELRPRSPLLRAPAPEGWKDEIVPGSSVSFLQIPPHDPDAAVPAGFLAKLRYCRRYAKRRGSVRTECADATSVDDATRDANELPPAPPPRSARARPPPGGPHGNPACRTVNAASPSPSGGRTP